MQKTFIQNEFYCLQEAFINSYFSKESHLECILKAKDELFKVRKGNKIYAFQIYKIYAAAPKLLKAIAENQGHHVE